MSLLEDQLKPLVEAEQSLLVDILYRSELLFPIGSESRKRCESGGFIRRLIKHTERLLVEKEEKLCAEVLRTLREMMALDSEHGEKGDKLRHILLERYFGVDVFRSLSGSPKIPLHNRNKLNNIKNAVVKIAEANQTQPTMVSHGPGAKMIQRAGRTLYEVQNMLDREGAGDLVVELVMNSTHSPTIFMESVELGIALLEGGNNVIQRGMFNKFLGIDPTSTKAGFFRVFYDKMKVTFLKFCKIFNFFLIFKFFFLIFL